MQQSDHRLEIMRVSCKYTLQHQTHYQIVFMRSHLDSYGRYKTNCLTVYELAVLNCTILAL